MPAIDGSKSRDSDADDGNCPAISLQRSSPERAVFTEEGNPDGWIGIDLTVDVRR